RRCQPYSLIGWAHASLRQGCHVANKKRKNEVEVVGFLGVGLDAGDDHQRLTRAENFLLIGGSSETHEQMQDTAIRFDESLKKRGKTLREADADEILDLLRDAMED